MNNCIVNDSLKQKVHNDDDCDSSDMEEIHSKDHHDEFHFDLAKILLINHDSYFICIWGAIHCTFAILSSYLYAWFAAFGN